MFVSSHNNVCYCTLLSILLSTNLSSSLIRSALIGIAVVRLVVIFTLDSGVKRMEIGCSALAHCVLVGESHAWQRTKFISILSAIKV